MREFKLHDQYGNQDPITQTYRIDKDEDMHAVYKSNDEIFCHISKCLLFQYDAYNDHPEKIIHLNLKKHEKEAFIEAYYYRLQKLSTFPDPGESQAISFLRRINAVFGSTLDSYVGVRNSNSIGKKNGGNDKKIRNANFEANYENEPYVLMTDDLVKSSIPLQKEDLYKHSISELETHQNTMEYTNISHPSHESHSPQKDVTDNYLDELYNYSLDSRKPKFKHGNSSSNKQLHPLSQKSASLVDSFTQPMYVGNIDRGKSHKKIEVKHEDRCSQRDDIESSLERISSFDIIYNQSHDNKDCKERHPPPSVQLLNSGTSRDSLYNFSFNNDDCETNHQIHLNNMHENNTSMNHSKEIKTPFKHHESFCLNDEKSVNESHFSCKLINKKINKCNKKSQPSLSSQTKVCKANEHIADIAVGKYSLAQEQTKQSEIHSNLRRKISIEIKKAYKIIKSTSNDKEREAYKRYVKELLVELPKYDKPSQKKSKGSTQELKHEDIVDFDSEWKRVVTESEKGGGKLVNIPKNKDSSEDLMFTIPCKVEEEHGTVISSKKYEPRTLQVLAPLSMKEGFTFTAKSEGEDMLIRVPRGGVLQGQIFSVPMIPLIDSESSSSKVVSYKSLFLMNIPNGAWRDNLFNCANDPLLLASFFCPHVALSQIKARLQLMITKDNKFEANSGVGVKAKFCFSVAFIICHFVMALMSFMVFVGHPGAFYTMLYMYPLLAVDLFLAYDLIKSIINTRKEIRKEYKIDGTICNKYDDFFISIVCPCLTISHMGRHTADYSTYRQSFFSDTGLPKNVELMLPNRYVNRRNGFFSEEIDEESISSNSNDSCSFNSEELL